MKKLMLIALSTLAMGAQAAEEKKFYAGGAGSFWKFDTDSASGNINVYALEGAFGYEALSWLAIEGRLGTGVGSDATTLYSDYYSPDDLPPEATYRQNAYELKTELDYYASFYVKPQIKNDVAVLYGLLGATTYSTSFTSTQKSYNVTYALDDDGIPQEVGRDLVDGSVVGPTEGDESETTFSMGFGVGFYFKERYVFNVEYKSYIHSMPAGDTDATFRASGVTAAVNYSF